jgi:hypothetical protein
MGTRAGSHDASIIRTLGSMSFPFDNTTYTGSSGANSILAISSNGFISLGGDNGTGCVDSDCSGDPQQLQDFAFPTIAPLWTDLNPGPGGGGDIYYKAFNDDADPAIDRIVITFASGFHDCVNAQCSALAQLQLLGLGNKYAQPAGTIIFGYNGIVQTNSQLSDILVGVSPVNDMVPALILFSGLPSTFNLDDTNLVFTPNGSGGFDVSDTLPDPPPSSAPPIWESALGATIRGVDGGLDDADDAFITRTFGSMSFPSPFDGGITTYTGDSILAISSNGFISLGGDNGTGCIDTDCSGDPQQLLGFPNPTIAPLWTNLEPGLGGGGDVYYNEFNDDADPAIDRIVITFATGFHDCVDAACSALAQLQLLGPGNKYAKPAGTIVFGYNGIVQTSSQLSNILIGVSPGNNAVDPGSTNLNAKSSFSTGAESTVYQLFVASSPPPIDLDGGNVVFEPNGLGGFVVSTPVSSGGGLSGGGGGGGGCVMQPGNAPDPLFPIMLTGLAVVYARRRRHRPVHQRVPG